MIIKVRGDEDDDDDEPEDDPPQAWRLIKCVGDSLQAPKEGWQTVAYLCVRYTRFCT